MPVNKPMLISLKHLKTGGEFKLEYLPHGLRYRHSTRIAQELAPGHLDPIAQFIGGEGSEYSLSVRLLHYRSSKTIDPFGTGLTNIVIPQNILGADTASYHRPPEVAKKWMELVESTDGKWAHPPIFELTIPPPFKTGDVVVVKDYDLDVNTSHNINKGEYNEQFGDITMNVTLVRARNFVATKPISVVIR